MRTIWAVAYTEYLSDPRVRREAEALVERGDRVTVFSLAETGRPPREPLRGVHLERLPVRRYRGGVASRYVRSYGQFFVSVLGWMAVHRPPDVVHVHTTPDALVFASLIPRLRGSRVVLDVHDLTPELFSLRFGEHSPGVRVLHALERLSLTIADVVITVHEPYRAILQARGVPARRLHVVMNVADEDVFGSTHRQPPQRSEGVTFVYHGTLVDRYGVDVLLRAFGRARACVRDIRLCVYGGGDYRPGALQLANELGLDGSVQFSPSFVPVDELPSLLAAADVGVVPNKANRFTRHILPTKLMEYAALGLPAIVSRTETVALYFADDMVYYVEPGDVDELAKAMVRLADNPELRQRLGSAIRRFLAQHNWATNKQALYRAIDAACSSAFR